ncbi:MAG: ABC transporter ATP-binding protein [Bryobacteraceae bacterium]
MSVSARRRPAPAAWRDRVQALGNVPPLLAMVARTNPPLVAVAVALRLVKSLIPFGMLWVGKLILDEVIGIRGVGGGTGGPEAGLSGRLATLVSIEIGLAVAGDLLTRGAALAESLLADKFTNEISLKLMQHASRLDLFHFEDPEFYDKLERARRQTTGRLGLLGAITTLAQDVVTLVTLAGGVVWFSPWLFGLLALAVVPVFLGETHFAGLAYSLLYRWTPERRELDYVRMLGASQQSAKEVKLFGLGPYLTERYRALAERFYAENRRLAMRRAVTGGALNLIGTAGYYFAYIFIIRKALAGNISIGDLTFLAGAFARSRSLLEGLLGAVGSIADQALYLTDLYDFFRMEPRMAVVPGALPAPRPIRTGFEFRDVSFHYPGSDRPVLDGVSFGLKPGERLALIGENGAGKTTLVKLLARLYDPTNGVILLDGIDLREYDPESLRAEIAVIFQDFMKYDLRAGENIGLGSAPDLDRAERIEHAAAASRADQVVAGLDGGYGQMLGRRFDGGVELSQGQWQKIALARAYMRESQLVILDEPTASLDARAEYEVFERLAALTQGRMAVLISHRFSTVRMADRIIVLGNGRIEEQGTHEELLARGGRYAELFELQAAGYR